MSMSRQYKYQLKKRLEGNCVICGKKADSTSKKYCLFHAAKQRGYDSKSYFKKLGTQG